MRNGNRWATAGLVILAVVAVAVVALAVRPTAQRAAEGTPTWTWSRTTPKPIPVAVFIGDSYTAGAGGGGVLWTSLVASKEGWFEVNLGRGGTGYIAKSGKQGCGRDYCPPYGEMIPEAVKAKPDVVLVAGGRNDGSVATTAIRNFYKDLRTQLPNAKIYAVSPLWDSTEPPAFILAQGKEVEASVKAVSGSYLDVGQPLKARPELLATDKVHPNAAGYQVIAEAVIKLLS